MTEMALAAATFPIPRATGTRDGDPQGLVEEAYAVHAAPLTRRLTAQMRDPAAAEDLVHEAFLRLATEIRAGRTPDNVGGWLYRVTANLVASRGRHSSVVERHAASVPQPGVDASPEAASLCAERNRMIEAALATLGLADRRALVLAAQGYRGAEIARRLGRTEGATRTLLCRARLRMRGQLEAAGIDR
jgi:RNA polymerase sigma factor (sigma-70 family)